jgi:hypothetical protein
MGMASSGGSKKKNGVSSAKNNGGGMGKKASSSTGVKQPYDVAKAWIKSQKLYDELMSESTRAFIAASDDGGDDDIADLTTEYIVAARCRAEANNGNGNVGSNGNGNLALRYASDWIPVAQMCVTRPIQPEDNGTHGGTGDEMMHSLPVRAAVSYYCREIFHAATLASPALKSLPRNLVEYSAEPYDSWIRHVYKDVIKGESSDSYVDESTGAKVGMTKGKAREVLGLEAGCADASVIKSAYKRESMACHPDRFVNTDKTREEVDGYTERFALVKMAYEALNSGVRDENNGGSSGGGGGGGAGGGTTNGRSSWYESLGGRSRTDFIGPIDLMPMEKAGSLCNKAFRSAVIGLDPDLTNAFVLRNQAAATAAAAARSG